MVSNSDSVPSVHPIQSRPSYRGRYSGPTLASVRLHGP